MVEQTVPVKFWHFKKLSILSVPILSTRAVVKHYKWLDIVLVGNCKFWLGDPCTWRSSDSHHSPAGQVLHAGLVVRLCWATLCHVTLCHTSSSSTASRGAGASCGQLPLSTVGKALTFNRTQEILWRIHFFFDHRNYEQSCFLVRKSCNSLNDCQGWLACSPCHK